MRYLVLSLIVWVFAALPAAAQSPTPESQSGYDFTPYNFTAGSQISSRVSNLVSSTPFMETAGKAATTTWAMVDATGFVGIFVVLLIGLKVIWWMYGNVTASEPPTAKLSDVSDDIAYIRRSNPFRRSKK